MKKLIIITIAMLFSFSASAQWSPWGLGLIQRPNAQTARIYLGVTNVVQGSNIVLYVDSLGRIVINSSASGSSSGTNGVNGTNAAIAIGSTTTLAPGSPATVSNSGTSLNAILEFGIPQGEPGETGATGPPGANGEDGTNGLNGSALRVQEVDGSPLVNNVTNIVVSNGTLTDDGDGNVTINIDSGVTSVTNSGGENSLISSSNPPIIEIKSISAGSNVTITDQGTNLVISSSGGGGGGSASGIDYQWTNMTPYSSGTNFYIDFSYPYQTWIATNFALRYSQGWPSGETGRVVNILIPPTNITRRIYVYDEATNWQTAGMNSQYILAANQGAFIRANIFTQGETNVAVTLIASRSVASAPGSFFNPLGIPGCILWLNASSGLYQDVAGTSPVTLDGQSVRRWEDQSGSGNHITNTSGSLTWMQFGAPNSRPSIRFPTVANAVSITSNLVAQPMWVFLVYQRNTTNAAIGLWEAKGGNGSCRVEVTSGGAWNMFQGSSLAFGTLLSYQMQLMELKFNNGGSLVKTNAVQAASGNTGSNLVRGFRVGSVLSGTAEFNGNIPEVMVYSADLTSQNISDIELYLNSKYSIY